MRSPRLTAALLAALAFGPGLASAQPFDLAEAVGLLTPSFRGATDSTYVGWDTWDDGGSLSDIINDSTPDVGTHTGSFVTTNGEDHISGSGNFYSSSGSIAEDVTFETAGTDGSGYTTVIVQAQTLFGGWGEPIAFGPIDGVDPVQVLMANNAAGGASLFAKYELPGTAGGDTLSMSSGPFSFASFGLYTVDTVWSPDGFAPDYAIATPEPAAAATALIALAGFAARRRR